MEISKLRWWWMVIVMALVIIVIPIIYYIFQREHYVWEQDEQIMKMSETFKSIRPKSVQNQNSNLSRTILGQALFPIIKIGMSTKEVSALLGKPSFIMTLNNGNELWRFTLWYGYEIKIENSNGKVVGKTIE